MADSKRFRPKGSEWGNAGYGAASTSLKGSALDRVPTESPEQRAVTRATLWRAARALDRLIRASAGRRDLQRFELALEEGSAALALLPKFAR